MGTTSFVLRRTYLALSLIPAVILLLLFTDEFSRFLDSMAASLPILATHAQACIILTLVTSFLLTFFLHKHFLRSRFYSIIATIHIPIQLVAIWICILIVTQVQSQSLTIGNRSYYLLFGFLLSIIISDVGYLVDYNRRSPKHLIKIENELSKKPRTTDERKPSFLRLGGFLWVDFETNRIVVRRDETKKVLERLKTENFVLIVGDQASGKSVILRNLGYLLSRSGFKVLFTNADSLNIDLAIEDIKNWNMSSVIILLDDVQRNPRLCADFLERTRDYNVKIVMSSRPLNFGVFSEGQGSKLIELFRKRVEVKVTEDVVFRMILSHYGAMPNHFFKDLRAKSVPNVMEKCGTDLWLITYLLTSCVRASYPGEEIDEVTKSDIYRRIYNTRVTKWTMIDRDSLNAMKTICALYQYEIPCAESYLIDVGLNSAAFKLSQTGHLIKRNRYYYLHHPSVARIYLETLEFNRLVKNSVKFSLETLFSYLEKVEEEIAHVFYRLSTSPKTPREKKEVLRDMLKSVEPDELVRHVKQENDISRIGLFFMSICILDEDFAKTILRNVDRKDLVRKFLKEPHKGIQRDFISIISKLDRKLARFISNRKLTIVAIIPLYNEEAFVPKILENISSYVDIVIVVDDGSSDMTGKLAEEAGAIVVRHHQKEGLWSSILTGLSEALSRKADVIIFDIYPWIRSDDFPTLLRPILEQNADLVIEKLHYTYAVTEIGAMMLHFSLSRFLSSNWPMPSVDLLYYLMRVFRKDLRVKEVEIKRFSRPLPYRIRMGARKRWLGPPFFKAPSFSDLFLLTQGYGFHETGVMSVIEKVFEKIEKLLITD